MLHMRMLATVAILALAAAEAQAPPVRTEQTPPSFMGPCSTLSCEVENDWTRNNVLLYMLARAMPEDKYGFKPVPEEQSFGERVLHVAQVNLSLLQGLGAKTPAPAIDPKATSKTEAMAALQKVGQYGSAVINEFGDQGSPRAWPRRLSWDRCRAGSGFSISSLPTAKTRMGNWWCICG